jgi:acyl-coenzyme A thioesterase PaaI-like protein
MYRNAPVNAQERFDSRVQLTHKRARVHMPPKPEYCHSAFALHVSNEAKNTTTVTNQWSVLERLKLDTSAARTTLRHCSRRVQGSNYFKMLDDACFFAAQSINSTHFVVTTSFTTYITRPVVPDDVHLVSNGVVTSASKSLILAEAVMCLPDGTEVGRGSGTFMPHPKFELHKIASYADEAAFPFVDEDAPLDADSV